MFTPAAIKEIYQALVGVTLDDHASDDVKDEVRGALLTVAPAHWTAQASALGEAAGKNAAEWWAQDAIGGRQTSGTKAYDIATTTLKGLEDGDPAVLDTLPRCDLSGEWAGERTPRTLLEDEIECDWEEICEDIGLDPMETQEAVSDAYETAFNDAVSDEIQLMCLNYTQPEKEDA